MSTHILHALACLACGINRISGEMGFLSPLAKPIVKDITE